MQRGWCETLHLLADSMPRRRLATLTRCSAPNEWLVGTVHTSIVHLLVALPYSPLLASRERAVEVVDPPRPHRRSARHRR
jgi:hypothetical protein